MHRQVDKTTTNTVRFREQGHWDERHIGVVYLTKVAWHEIDDPETVTVYVENADDS